MSCLRRRRRPGPHRWITARPWRLPFSGVRPRILQAVRLFGRLSARTARRSSQSASTRKRPNPATQSSVPPGGCHDGAVNMSIQRLSTSSRSRSAAGSAANVQKWKTARTIPTACRIGAAAVRNPSRPYGPTRHHKPAATARRQRGCSDPAIRFPSSRRPAPGAGAEAAAKRQGGRQSRSGHGPLLIRRRQVRAAASPSQSTNAPVGAGTSSQPNCPTYPVAYQKFCRA
jgi:hypothetical protein